MWVILWVFIWPVFLIFLRKLRGQNRLDRGHAGVNKTALDLLKERYAKGEIDKTTFEEIRKDL